ncbi:hypothetical protein ACQ4PT_053684 [Festuca glaucescens]
MRALPPAHVFILVILAAAVVKMRRMRRGTGTCTSWSTAASAPRPATARPFATCLEHAHLMPYLVDEESVAFAMRAARAVGARRGDLRARRVPLHAPGPQPQGRPGRRPSWSSSPPWTTCSPRRRVVIKPADIDVLVVNCSIFTPVPVFADMVVNRYKLRADVKIVNLSGMGCSAGLVSVGLAKNVLQTAPPGTRVLIVSTEILSSQYYVGTERAMLLPNCLFRMGAAAMILSNSADHARFRLRRVVRTVTAARDADYRCVFQEEDDNGNTGIRLSKDLATTAGYALKNNIAAFGPLVLPAWEQLLVALTIIKRKLLSGRAKHGLGLSDDDVEASRMTLHRFGNTSSSSVLYELAYLEAKGRMGMGDRVWMISFGAGFDCNSVAWECLKPASNADGPWAECISRYPVQLPEIDKDM